jgi:polysaccharide export outer membrane protein
MCRKKLISSVTILGLLGTLCTVGTGCVETQGMVMPPQMTPTGPPPPIPTELHKQALPTYRVEPPDILLIDVFLPPKDVLELPVPLWPQPIQGQHLVRIDGTISLGSWGEVPVAGLTLKEAAEAVRYHVFNEIIRNETIRLGLNEAAKEPKAAPGKDAQEKGEKKRAVIGTIDKPEKLIVAIDVFSYNSKTYYIITDGAGYGEQIYSFPVTGNDTVLQALANINGLPYVSSKRQIWVARRTPVPDIQQILPVDYVGMTQHGITATNYQVLPGDRIYVHSEKIFGINNFLQKYLTPVERVLGVGLLTGNTIQSFRSTGTGTGQ